MDVRRFTGSDADRRQRFVIVGTLVATVLLVLPTSADPFGLVKLAALWFGLLALYGLLAFRFLLERRLDLPAGLVVWIVLAFVVAVLLATATADILPRAVLGQPGRATGALLYVGCAALFLAVLQVFRLSSVPMLLATASTVGVAVALYALLQRSGADPVAFAPDVDGFSVYGTIGNRNFLSGFLGISLPLLLAQAFLQDGTSRWFAAGGALVIAAGLWAATSVQGAVAGFGGSLVVLAGWLLDAGRRRQLIALLTASGMAAVLGVLGTAGLGPAGLLYDAGNMFGRSRIWATAINIFWDRPLLGVGFDLFGEYSRQYRPSEVGEFAAFSDAAHNVPLGMFATGGSLLGLTYLAFIGVIGFLLFRGLVRCEGRRRILIAAVGGGWLAYQLQSLVSLDVPPLPVYHFVLSALAVVLTGQFNLVTLEPFRPANRSARPSMIVKVACFVMVLLLSAAAIALVRPLRADRLAGSASRLYAVRAYQAAASQYEMAVELAPWAGEYWEGLGRARANAGDLEGALWSFEQAVERNEMDLSYYLNLARTADRLGRYDRAETAYRHARALEPNAAELETEIDEFRSRRAGV